MIDGYYENGYNDSKKSFSFKYLIFFSNKLFKKTFKHHADAFMN